MPHAADKEPSDYPETVPVVHLTEARACGQRGGTGRRWKRAPREERERSGGREGGRRKQREEEGRGKENKRPTAKQRSQAAVRRRGDVSEAALRSGSQQEAKGDADGRKTGAGRELPVTWDNEGLCNLQQRPLCAVHSDRIIFCLQGHSIPARWLGRVRCIHFGGGSRLG